MCFPPVHWGLLFPMVHSTCRICSFFKTQFKFHYLNETIFVFLMKTENNLYTLPLWPNTSYFLFKDRELHTFQIILLPKETQSMLFYTFCPKKKKKKGWMTEWLSECMYVRMYKVEWINESMNERIAWNEMATEY